MKESTSTKTVEAATAADESDGVEEKLVNLVVMTQEKKKNKSKKVDEAFIPIAKKGVL